MKKILMLGRKGIQILPLIFLLIAGIAWADEMKMVAYYPGSGGTFDRLHATKVTVGSAYDRAAIPDNDPRLSDGTVLISNRLGIGTTTPQATLDVVGPATGTGVTLHVGGGGDVMLAPGGSLFFDDNYSYATGSYMRSIAPNTQAFFTSGAERLRITPTGNVGIGTSTPRDTLEVKGGIWTDGGRMTINGYDGIGFFWMKTSGTEPNSVFLGIHSNDGLAPDFVAIAPGGGALVKGGQGGLFVRDNVTGNGRVGIGTASPDSLLTISGNSTAPYILNVGGLSNGRIKVRHIDGKDYLSLGIDNLYLQYGVNFNTIINGGGSGGFVGIGTDVPAFRLDVAGAAHASSFPTSSDMRLKTHVTPLTNVLDKLEKIHGVSFEWNDTYKAMGRSTDHREIGVVAQEVEAVFPELVTQWGKENYRAVDYGRLTGVLIEAVKELKAENEALKKRIEVLEKKQR